MSKEITFMLDMDGVCCDWVKAALTTLDKKELIGKWTSGSKDLSHYTGLSYKEIWDKIDPCGSDWWRNLEEYPWFTDLYNTLSCKGNVVFCSSPSWDANSLKGKIEWLQDRFGNSFRNYILTNKKYYVASKKNILIDDNEEQCACFIANGGRAILFPNYGTKHTETL